MVSVLALMLFFLGCMLTTDFLPHLFSLNPELENLFFSGPVTDSIPLCYLFTIKDNFKRVLADLEQVFFITTKHTIMI